MRRRFTRVAAVLALAALAACGTAPGAPPIWPYGGAPPPAWDEPAAGGAPAAVSDWWRGFDSPELDRLVVQALLASPDMAIAAERVLQAQAQAHIAGAAMFPAVNFSATTAQRELRIAGGSWNALSSSGATLAASYEVDLWGRVAAGERSAEASLDATRFDQQVVRLTLVAGVASGYFQLLALRGRIEVARENLAIAERVLKVVDARVRFGANTTLDLTFQQEVVLGLRASLLPLQLQERQTLVALALLLGRVPEGFDAAGADLAPLVVPAVDAGVPAQLITRRPDLASAEAQLAAANADVAAARAALLPGISLTASAGLASELLVNFLHAPSAALSIGAALLQPIFDAGRLRSQVDISQSRERELVENYRRSVFVALQDVENALAAGSRSLAQEELQREVVALGARALQLAQARYRAGADDLLSVLVAQRALFQAQDQLAQIRLARLLASVDLFKALGGGWTRTGTAPAG